MDKRVHILQVPFPLRRRCVSLVHENKEDKEKRRVTLKLKV